MRLDRLPAEGEDFRRKAARWAKDHFEKLKNADPVLPAELNDRAQDNWRPLMAIAVALGGEWPELARKSALALMKAGDSETHVQLLADILTIFKRPDIWDSFSDKKDVRLSSDADSVPSAHCRTHRSKEG
jgi:putative DNA primase/helicase